MNSLKIDLGDAGKAEIDISPAFSGSGVVISQKFIAIDGTLSTTVTCTCTDQGNTYSTSKSCANGNNTCDCSTPSNPRIICG
ncbi:hypothetical protein Q5M48_03260 [Acinetobacter nosocomialis]|uniref:hypothetical protein n=1 Tax=Acinetobacter nosocomialis TaxID=106654 RepID=UPI0026EA4C39|nr:hypothetical protein [Acinetobacter nosocomialis]MDO7207205.1 hypothetical protein [Acinetobacter nosocomialis]